MSWCSLTRVFATAGAALPIAVAAQGSLSLEDAVRLGLSHSPRITAQDLAVQAADTVVERAAELPDPKLRFGIDNLPVNGEDRLRYDRDFMTMRFVGVMQEFPHGAKRRAARGRALSEVVMARALHARERTLVRREAATAWVEHAFAKAMRTRLDELDRQIGFERDAVGPAIAAGRVGASEAFALRTAQESVRDRAIAADRRIERARIELARLIGEAHAGRTPAERSFVLAPVTDSDAGPIVEAHPAAVLARAQLQVARADLERARASSAVDWSVQASFAQREPAFANMASVMVQMDLPLWQARRQGRDVAARVTDIERVRAQLEDARRMALAELRGFASDHAHASRRVAQYDEALLPSAREGTAAALAAYRGGRGALAAVLSARRAETELELAKLDAERERAVAWVNLQYLALDPDDRARLAGED